MDSTLRLHKHVVHMGLKNVEALHLGMGEPYPAYPFASERQVAAFASVHAC